MSNAHDSTDQVLCFDPTGRICDCAGALLPASVWLGQSVYTFPLIESIGPALWSLPQNDFPLDFPNISFEGGPLTGFFDLRFYKLSDTCMQLVMEDHSATFEERQRQKQAEMETQLQGQQHKL